MRKFLGSPHVGPCECLLLCFVKIVKSCLALYTAIGALLRIIVLVNVKLRNGMFTRGSANFGNNWRKILRITTYEQERFNSSFFGTFYKRVGNGTCIRIPHTSVQRKRIRSRTVREEHILIDSFLNAATFCVRTASHDKL